MHIKTKIKTPCSTDWESMKIGLHSRYCESCQKNVIDFTNKDKKEILKYLLENQEKRTCGRFYSNQLDFHHTDILVTISTLSKKNKSSNLPFYLLAISSLFLASCSNNPAMNSKIVNVDSTSTQTSANNTTKPDTSIKEELEIEYTDTLFPLIGEVEFEFETNDTSMKYTCDKNGNFTFVENMPEFKGGIDSLILFITQNVKYPEWERKNNIQGTVYSQFTIDLNGKVKDVEIIKTVEGSKFINEEVLRVINKMPDWIPGKHKGKNVNVKFTLPVKFNIDSKNNNRH